MTRITVRTTQFIPACTGVVSRSGHAIMRQNRKAFCCVNSFQATISVGMASRPHHFVVPAAIDVMSDIVARVAFQSEIRRRLGIFCQLDLGATGCKHDYGPLPTALTEFSTDKQKSEPDCGMRHPPASPSSYCWECRAPAAPC